MADKLKAPLFILIILMLISLFFAGGVFNLLHKERSKNLMLTEELQEIKTRQRITETKLQESNKALSALELKLQESEAQISTLNSQLEQERSEKQKAQGEIEQLKAGLEQQKTIRSDLEKQLDQKHKEAQNLQAQLNELGSKKMELETKINDLETQFQQAQEQKKQQEDVELGKIVVSPQETASFEETSEDVAALENQEKDTSPGFLEGKVLVVNKDYNFVVINLGSKDDVGIGDVFSVYENNKYVGDIKVEKVHDSMAAADFLSSQMKDKVSEGDRVVRKSK